MKAILKYPLYRRPQPTNEVAANNYLPQGSVIDVEKIVQGKAIDNISSWYKATDGFYYWGGGINVAETAVIKKDFLTNPFFSIVNYNANAFASIPINVRNTKGINTRIAIIDTGINQKNLSFQGDKIKVISDFTSSAAGIVDINGHGSHVAGLVGGRSASQNGIIGIAPLSELFIFKGIDDDGSTSANNLNKALKAAIDLNVDIINLSLDIAPQRFNIIESEINRALNNGIIIIAAAGENLALSEGNSLLCPADKAGIIAVGSCDETQIQNPPAIHNKVNCIVPNFLFWSCFNEEKIFFAEKGSSMATAFVTGIVSLVISFSGNRDITNVVKALANFSIPFSQYEPGEVCLLNPHK